MEFIQHLVFTVAVICTMLQAVMFVGCLEEDNLISAIFFAICGIVNIFILNLYI